ncbi:MAG TPA: FG-GAP-like repeat-containing protein, partial [Kribbellaceae bacterium]
YAGTGGLRIVGANVPVRLGWTHVTGVYDAPAHQLRVYVQGELAGVLSDVTIPAIAAGPTTVGRAKWNGAQVDFTDGFVDEVRTFSRALSAAEIKELNRTDRAGQQSAPAGASINGDAYADLADVNNSLDVWDNTRNFPGWPWNQKNTGNACCYPNGDQVKFADLDGDGRSELIEINMHGDGIMYAWHNTGSFPGGTWGTRIEIGSGWYDGTKVFFADLTGDGRAELINVDGQNDGRIRAWRNTSGFDTRPGYPWTEDPFVIGYGWTANRARFGDMDGDGRADLVGIGMGANGTSKVQHNNGQFGTSAMWDTAVEVLPAGTADPARYRLADLNGDGMAELIGINEFNNSGLLRAWPNTGKPNSPWESVVTIGNGWTSPARAVFG